MFYAQLHKNDNKKTFSAGMVPLKTLPYYQHRKKHSLQRDKYFCEDT